MKTTEFLYPELDRPYNYRSTRPPIDINRRGSLSNRYKLKNRPEHKAEELNCSYSALIDTYWFQGPVAFKDEVIKTFEKTEKRDDKTGETFNYWYSKELDVGTNMHPNAYLFRSHVGRSIKIAKTARFKNLDAVLSFLQSLIKPQYIPFLKISKIDASLDFKKPIKEMMSLLDFGRSQKFDYISNKYSLQLETAYAGRAKGGRRAKIKVYDKVKEQEKKGRQVLTSDLKSGVTRLELTFDCKMLEIGKLKKLHQVDVFKGISLCSYTIDPTPRKGEDQERKARLLLALEILWKECSPWVARKQLKQLGYSRKEIDRTLIKTPLYTTLFVLWREAIKDFVKGENHEL